MGFKPGLTADNEPETLKAQAFSVGQSEYSGQVNDAVRSSATATEFLATDGNPVLQGGEAERRLAQRAIGLVVKFPVA